jgi:hypothetical protein
MIWFEDDSKGIPDYIKEMSPKELDAIIKDFERKTKHIKHIDREKAHSENIAAL